MLSKRLTKIASFVPKGSTVLDLGTDHALLPIYLIKEKICPKVIASDISKGALANAQKNIEKYGVKNISLVLSDGLESITEKYDTLVISGMGTNLILKILEDHKLPDFIIISSHNLPELLRKKMLLKGYMISREVTFLDHKKYYDIIFFEKGKEKISKDLILFGKSDNLLYFKDLYLKKEKLYQNLPNFKKIKLKSYLKRLRKHIKKLEKK